MGEGLGAVLIHFFTGKLNSSPWKKQLYIHLHISVRFYKTPQSSVGGLDPKAENCWLKLFHCTTITPVLCSKFNASTPC